MPSDTFFRLPEAKRQRVYRAAVEEFAEHSFSDASINRIVKAARIPRGSFYQYFADKQDLYLYVMREIGKAKIDVFAAQQSEIAPDAGFFERMMAAMPIIIDWAERNPLYNRIGLWLAQDDSAVARSVIEEMGDSRQFFTELLQSEQKAGRVRPDVDVSLVSTLISAMAIDLLRDYYQSAGHEEALQRFRSCFDIICHGIATKAEETR